MPDVSMVKYVYKQEMLTCSRLISLETCFAIPLGAGAPNGLKGCPIKVIASVSSSRSTLSVDSPIRCSAHPVLSAVAAGYGSPSLAARGIMRRSSPTETSSPAPRAFVVSTSVRPTLSTWRDIGRWVEHPEHSSCCSLALTSDKRLTTHPRICKWSFMILTVSSVKSLILDAS